MKKIFKAICVCLFLGCMLSSCVQYKEIGRLNMVSTRNVSPGEIKYALLASYAGEDKKDIKKAAGKDLFDAIENVIRQWPGGEFMTNVKIFRVHVPCKKDKKFAVAGDIYGIANTDGQVQRTYRGFALGDTVMWKAGSGFKSGKIVAFQDDVKCLIKMENGKVVRQKYTKLSK